MIAEKDLDILSVNLERIIELITSYGCVNQPDIKRLKLMQKNIDMFKEANEGWDELKQYLIEDWDAAMRSQPKVIDCYISSEDIDFKAECNKELEKCFKELDKLFETNWIMSRKWYTKSELIALGRNFGERDLVLQKFAKLKSQIEGISDEAWTYAKGISIASDDEKLIKWFHSDIPAFGYISLLDMSELENGEQIVRHFLTSIPLAFP